jgi:hypothetical protein
MTVSGTTSFSMTVSEIVTEARGLLGIQAAEEPLQADELQQGIRALNMMLKAWQAEGVQTWTLTEGTFTLVQGDFDYVFGSGGTFTTVPLDITDVRITRSSTSMPMFRLSREDYYDLPLPSSEGYPTQFYYDRQRDGGTLFVWPAPDSQGGTIDFTYRRYVMDAGDGTNTLDLPTEWHEAVCYNLAKRLISYYPGVSQTILPHVLNMAASTYAIVKGFDIGEGMGSLSISPDYWSGQ